MPLNTQSILTCEKDEIISANLIFLCEYGGIYNRNVFEDVISVKINRCENPGKFCGVHQYARAQQSLLNHMSPRQKLGSACASAQSDHSLFYMGAEDSCLGYPLSTK